MNQNEGRMETKMEDKRGLNRNNESRATEGPKGMEGMEGGKSN